MVEVDHDEYETELYDAAADPQALLIDRGAELPCGSAA